MQLVKLPTAHKVQMTVVEKIPDCAKTGDSFHKTFTISTIVCFNLLNSTKINRSLGYTSTSGF